MRGNRPQPPKAQKESLKDKAFLLSVDLGRDVYKIATNLKAFFRENPRTSHKQPVAFIVHRNQLTFLVHLLYSLQQGEDSIIPKWFDIRHSICYILSDDLVMPLSYEDQDLPANPHPHCQETIDLLQGRYQGASETSPRQRISNGHLNEWLCKQADHSVWLDITNVPLYLIAFVREKIQVALLKKKVGSALVRADVFPRLYAHALSDDFRQQKRDCLSQYLADHREQKQKIAVNNTDDLVSRITEGTFKDIKDLVLPRIEEKIRELAESELSKISATLMCQIFTLCNAVSSESSPLKIVDEGCLGRQKGLANVALLHYAPRAASSRFLSAFVKSPTCFFRADFSLVSAWVRHGLNDQIGMTPSTKPCPLILNGDGGLVPSTTIHPEDLYVQALNKRGGAYYPDLRIKNGCVYNTLEGECVLYFRDDLSPNSLENFIAQVDYWLCGILNDDALLRAKIELGVIGGRLNNLFGKALQEKEASIAETLQESFLRHVISIAKGFFLVPQELLSYLEIAKQQPIVSRRTGFFLGSSRIQASPASKFLQAAINHLRKGEPPDSAEYKGKTWGEFARELTADKIPEDSKQALAPSLVLERKTA